MFDRNLVGVYSGNASQLRLNNVSLYNIAVIVADELDGVRGHFLQIRQSFCQILSRLCSALVNLSTGVSAVVLVDVNKSAVSGISRGDASYVMILIVETNSTSVLLVLQVILGDVVNLGLAGYINAVDGVLLVRAVYGAAGSVLNRTETSSPM